MKLFSFDGLIGLAAIVSGLATLASAFFLRRQNIFLKPKVNISFLQNPVIWKRGETIKIKICNSSSYPVVIDDIQVINTLNEKKGEPHERALDIIDKDAYLKQTEVLSFVLDNAKNYPINIPLRIEVCFRSSVDNFNRTRRLFSNERTIIK
ncbi:MAG: hypothetical protein ACOYJ8_03775 [Patescibacteria group bacterium]|jgi:hypothetical protein